MRNLSEVRELKQEIQRLENYLQEQKQTLIGARKRISELHADIENLLRKNAELKHQIEIKNSIMRKQAVQLDEYMRAVHKIE